MFPPTPLVFYAPFLILALGRFSLTVCLWLSLFSGLLLDLFSTSFFATSSINYLLATLAFYPIKNLFNEKSLSISIASALFSLLFSLIEFFLFLLFKRNEAHFFSIFLATPLFNALYALLWFALPTKGIEMIQQAWKKNRENG